MKKFLKKKSKKKNFYSRAGQDGRSDEDKQTIFFLGPKQNHISYMSKFVGDFHVCFN